MHAEATKQVPEERDPGWLKYLETDRNGGFANTLYNLNHILDMDEKLQGIRLNELSGCIEVTEALPWRGPAKGGPVWRDSDDANLMFYVETNYGVFSQSFYPPALLRTADKRSFHPVRNYFMGLEPWDETPRVDTLLIDYLGAPDTPYVRAVTARILIAALNRAFHPGLKFDNILVLSGPQGIGKSTLISRLGMEWYSDCLTLSDMNDKTAAEKLQGYWLIEIGEMAGMRKADLEKVKSFLTRQDDKFREAYGRRVASHPRQCVFFGTTNNTEGYLRDVTGNRRFWNVPVTGQGPKKPWELDPETVKQIWAETVARFDESLLLPPELEAEAREAQRAAMEQDDREGLVRDYLKRDLPGNWDDKTVQDRVRWLRDGPGDGWIPRDKVSNIEIWCECFGRAREDLTRRESAEITAIMARIEGWERAEGLTKLRHYGPQRVYVRQVGEETEPLPAMAVTEGNENQTLLPGLLP